MIQVGFSTTNKILSRVIRKFTGSKASHCFIVFDWLGGKYVLEAGFFGVVLLPFPRFKEKSTVIDLITPKKVVNLDLRPAMERLGERYDFGGLFGSMFVLLGRWFKKKAKNPWNNSKALFCSELVAQVLKEANYPGTEDIDPSDISPEDLLELLNT